MDVSLYKLALSIERHPQPLSVNPVTLLSLVESVIDLLVEQQISATLWLKLPPGEIWRSEIRRYHEQVKVAHTIYSCHTQKAELIAPAKDGSPIVPIQLAATSQLRRDYFLLVLSPQFCSLVLAHRPRIRRHRARVNETAKQKKIPPLLSMCSFEGQVIQGVLDGIKHAVTQSVRLSVARSQSQTTPTDLLANWDTLFIFPSAPDPVLLDQLLAKQIQRQNTIRRGITNERVTALQLQNQELLNILSRKDESLISLCQELRTPLTLMKAALSLLNSSQLKPPQRQRYLQILSTECDRQNSLINGLLELTQLDRAAEPMVLKPIRLSDIVPGVVSTYQPLAQEKGVQLAYTVSSDLPSVACTNAWLKQIVINLLHNSIKFTPSGGQVWVKARLEGDYVQLEFRDTGIGIPPSEIPKIFDRFYRVRPVAGEDPGGAGLGLTIVQQLLWRCGGSISVKSKLGDGSTFNLLLPIASSTLQASLSD
jgi:signal transduction histidine kinase